MSQPSPPDEVVPTGLSVTDDVSALTPPTGGIAAASIVENWLKPNSVAGDIFSLEKRQGLLKTPLWRFFHIVKEPKDDVDEAALPANWNEDNVFACCNNCGDLVVVAVKDSKSGKPKSWRNTSMAAHLSSGKHSTTVSILDEQFSDSNKKRKTQSSIIGFAKQGIKKIPLEIKMKNQDLKTTKFIVDCMLPFQTVEEKSFREMISSHNPQARVMSNKKIKNIIIDLDSEIRNAATEAMKGLSVCLTLDHWTSKAHHNYTGMTAHFIDDNWKIHNMPLGIFLHEGGSTAAELEISFLDLCLNKVQLSDAKIFAITTDTTSNMNSFGMKLKKNLKIEHVYCTDHVLQLTCKSCYTDATETFGEQYVQAVKKAKAIVNFFHKSTQATEQLKKKQSSLDSCKGVPKGVVDDVVTRWWSTFDMISRMLELKPVIILMMADNQLAKLEPLTAQDWENLHNITLVLKPFKFAQKILEGEKYVTASLVAQAVNFIKKKLKAMSGGDQPENASKVLSANLLMDFEKRWTGPNNLVFSPNVRRGEQNRQVGIHPYLLIATFLDPRTKDLQSVSDESSVTNEIKDHVLCIWSS
jgi:hypothetical protein